MPWQLILEISQDWFSCWISRVEFVSPSPFFLVIHFCSLLLYVDAGSASTWGMAGVSAGNAKASSHTVVVQGSFPTVALFGEMTVCVLSLSVVSNSVRPLGLWPTRLLCPWGFSRQEYWSGLPCCPPGDLPTQGSNPAFPHCRQIPYHVCHQGSPARWQSLC